MFTRSFRSTGVCAQVFDGTGGRVRRPTGGRKNCSCGTAVAAAASDRRPVPEHRVRGHQDEPDAVGDRGPDLDPRPGPVRAPLAPVVGLPLRVPDAAGPREGPGERRQSGRRRGRRARGMAGGRGERRSRRAVLAVFGRPLGNHDHRFRHAHVHGNVPFPCRPRAVPHLTDVFMGAQKGVARGEHVPPSET